MTPDEALIQARKVPPHAINFSEHARKRRVERRANAADVCSALSTAKVAIAQVDGAWRFEGGVDLDGDDLIVVAVFRHDLLVVSIF